MKVIQVCKDCCKKQPVEVKVGNKVHTFCCKKGFEESLEQFLIFMKIFEAREKKVNDNG